MCKIGEKKKDEEVMANLVQVMLSNEQYHKRSNKFVVQKPDPSPTIKVNIKLDIMASMTVPTTE